MSFKDHFSGHAGDYAAYRPTYPQELFDWLAGLTHEHGLAWDCGCGNGQASVEIAKYYSAVVATDPSAPQIEHAEPHERITYRVEPAEKTTLSDATVDLVTVAQALHWFDMPAFYREVDRVLKVGGVLAVWGYWRQFITPELDRIINQSYRDAVAPYWPPERSFVDDQYATIPFPFPEISPPALAMHQEWTLPHLVGYLQSWSATKRYQKTTGSDPVDLILADLTAAWGDPGLPRKLTWPLFLRVGRKAS